MESQSERAALLCGAGCLGWVIIAIFGTLAAVFHWGFLIAAAMFGLPFIIFAMLILFGVID